MANQLISEIRKTTSTRTWWLMGLVMVLATTSLVAIMAMAGLTVESSPLDLTTARGIHGVYSVSATMTYVFTLVAGILISTSEYATGTIAQTFLANPRRFQVFTAKTLIAAASGAVFGVMTVAASVGITAALVSSRGLSTHLGEPSVLLGLLGTVLTLTLWAVIGAGLGALVRNQWVAILAVVLLSQAVEPILRMVLPGWAANFLPGSLADAASGGTVISLAMGPSELGQATALAAMAGLALVVTALGTHRFRAYQVQ